MNKYSDSDEHLARHLAESLKEDPFYQAISVGCVSGASGGFKTLTAYLKYAIWEAREYGELVTIDGVLAGAALWDLPLPPTQKQAAEQQKRVFLRGLLPERGYANYQAIISYMIPRAASVVPNDSWYLSILGVSPQKQGKGLGKHLVGKSLVKADMVQATCYLETYKHSNLGFYQKLGFEIAGTYEEPLTKSRYWLMLRVPQSAMGT